MLESGAVGLLESKSPPPERGDQSKEGTGIKFVSVWNESLEAMEGDMNEESAGEDAAGGLLTP